MMLELQDLQVSYGGIRALKGVSIQVNDYVIDVKIKAQKAYSSMLKADDVKEKIVDYLNENFVENVNFEVAEKYISDEEKKKIYRAIAEAQISAWNKGSGYFYWSYKLLTDTVNDRGWIGWDSWDLGRCVDFGWFPT